VEGRRGHDEIMSAGDWTRVYRHNPIAPFLEEDNRRAVGGRRRHVDCLEDLLEGRSYPGGSTLELGCGTALDTIGLHDRLGFGSGMVMDFCPEALSFARDNVAGRDIDVVQASVLEFDTDRRFDVVFSVGLVEHFRGEARRRVVDQHARLLRAGGRALILAPNRGVLWPAVWLLNQFSRIQETPPTRRELADLCGSLGREVHKAGTYFSGIWVGVAFSRHAAG
jgi:SAM-dependent methyltransferase